MEAKTSILLCTRDGYLLEPTEWPKGTTPPVEFGERNRDCALGHGGKGMPSSRDDGGVSGFFSSGGPSVRSLTRYDGEVSEPLVGRQGSRVSMRDRKSVV